MSDHQAGSSAPKLNGKASSAYGPFLPRTGSAWEILRRNADCHRNRQAARSRRLTTIYSPSSVRIRRLRQWQGDAEPPCRARGIAGGDVATGTGVKAGLGPLRAGSNSKTTSGYDEIESWIEDQIQQLREGHIAIAVPKQMRVGKYASVEVGISTTGLSKLVAALHADPKLKIDQIHVGRFMEVAVTGEHFKVTPEGDAERLVLDDAPAIWTFAVQPEKRGRHILHIQAFIRVKLPGNTEERRDLPAIDKIVRVRSSVPYALSRFWIGHWRKLLAVGSVLGGLVAYVFSLDPVKDRINEILMMFFEHIKPLL
ncbi:MAG: hypothetical protein OEU25_11130 [Rhodospirillales bacterium]|nr:hypothetical protein [Rhodospirillales bacterium]MDH3918721.1 hypothetical protein [Rhodospirillales bacterium]MDH3968821.1 hypothetical protein [Rhodospirillales bacterium]